jgi:glycosyltransferase involved in cell wall biosynthesis
MKYALVLITHGRAETLERTLASFEEMVFPAPRDRIVIADGADSRLPHGKWDIVQHETQFGFCTACRSGWRKASASECEFVFWLENDFRFLRPLDLRQLAEHLRRDHLLAQMSLLRQSVSPQEHQHGGVIEALRARGHEFASNGAWLRHRAYFTTNPSLMRRTFMADNPWPAYERECEGRFGLDLIARGYSFGIWGNGEPWVEHIGVRDGYGY